MRRIIPGTNYAVDSPIGRIVDVELSSIVHQASRTLTNNEVIHLPTTELSLAGGMLGNLLIPILAFFCVDTQHGVYTHIDSNFSILTVAYDGWRDSAFMQILNDSTAATPQTALTDFLGGSGDQKFAWAPAELVGFTAAGVSGIVSLQPYKTYSAIIDLGFSIEFNNNIAGNLTGGNSANTLQIAITFYVYSILLNRFLTVAESGWNQSTRLFET